MQVNLIGPQLKQLFENSKNALIILGENANDDAAALAASLVEVFVSYKKEAVLVSRNALPEAVAALVKPGQLKTAVEPKSLVLSFDWAKVGLERVSYKVEGERFNLIVHSKGRKINPNDIEFLYQGTDFDLIVTVGVKKIEELLAFGLEEEVFRLAPTINFAHSLNNTNFAKLNIVNETTDSLSALAVNTLAEAKITLPTRAAEHLFYGMRTITNNFEQVSDPATFEAAAVCKRAMIPFFNVPEAQNETSETEKPIDENTPEGWLQPKVFRSRGLS